MSLDAFVSHSKPPPEPIASSSKIHDRASVFEACIYSATTASQAEKLRVYVGAVVHKKNPASHEMAAWRCMQLKKGKSGLGEDGEDDFEVVGGWKNDGEDGGGKRILETMQAEGMLDAVVVVSRWYGGTLLGPVRFTHIEDCTREVCRKFKDIEEVRECIETLRSLDRELSELRSELASVVSPTHPASQPYAVQSSEPVPVSSQTSSEPTTAENGPESRKRKREEGDNTGEKNDRQKPPPDYEKMLLQPQPDILKAKRLAKARQSAVKSVQSLLARAKETNGD